MLENIGLRRRAAPSEDEPRGDELIERLAQLPIVAPGQCGNQLVGEFAPDRRADLGYFFDRRQTVEARHQRGMEARRYSKCWQRPVENIAVVLLAQHPPFQQRFRQLLNKERYSIGASNDALHDLIGQRLVSGDSLDEHRRLALLEAAQSERRHMRQAGPGRVEFGPASRAKHSLQWL